LERLNERLVRKIRQWRPEVVVTEPPGRPEQRAVSHLVNRLVLGAVRQAADPEALPEHGELAGLAPWAVHKVVAEAERADLATMTVTTSQLATRLGCSIADYAARGHALLHPDYHSVPLKLGFDVLWTNLPQATGQQSLFSGIHLQVGGEARRVLGRPQGDLRSLTRAAQKRRNLQQLFNRTATSSLNSAGWLGQLDDLTRGLSRDAAGQLLYQLAEHYHQAGQWELAAQTLEQLIRRAPDHALSDSALVRLLQQHSSAEIAWQLRGQTRVQSQVVRAIPFAPANRDGVQTAHHIEPPAPPAGRSAKVTRESVSGTASLEHALSERADRGLVYGRTIQRTRPALFADPQVRFPMSVAYRAKGMAQDAQRFYHRLAALPDESRWEACAKAELWFVHGRGACPKPRYRCRATASRPRLDGRLEDETWADAAVMDLESPHHDDQQWPAVVMLAWDEQFLFLAATCRKFPGRDYAALSRPRPRDGDLRSCDRIELLLDTDRDYTTYYQLRVDERGWTGEACAGSSQWNPTWYVAAEQTDQDWTVEAAIPFSELGPVPGRGGQHIWAVGVQRILPGVGIQSYTPPAAVAHRTAGFALLTFQ
jgi:hypothetical protein